MLVKTLFIKEKECLITDFATEIGDGLSIHIRIKKTGRGHYHWVSNQIFIVWYCEIVFLFKEIKNIYCSNPTSF